MPCRRVTPRPSAPANVAARCCAGFREGVIQAPFLTVGYEGLNIDDEEDFARAEQLLADGRAQLVDITREPYPGEP